MSIDYSLLDSPPDPAPLLAKWRGGRAALWEYAVTHRALELRVEREATEGHLRVACWDVQRLCGPTKWADCRLEVERNGPEVILRDRGSGFELTAAAIGARESSRRIYER